MPIVKRVLVIRSASRIAGSPSQFRVKLLPGINYATKVKLLFFSGFRSDNLQANNAINCCGTDPSNIVITSLASSGTQGVVYDTETEIIVTRDPALRTVTVSTLEASGRITADSAQITGYLEAGFANIPGNVDLGSANIANNLNVNGEGDFNTIIVNNDATLYSQMTVNNAVVQDGLLASGFIEFTDNVFITNGGILEANFGISIVNDLTVTQGLHPNQIRPTGNENDHLVIQGGVPVFRSPILDYFRYESGGFSVNANQFVYYNFLAANVVHDPNGLIRTDTDFIELPAQQTWYISTQVQTLSTSYHQVQCGYDNGAAGIYYITYRQEEIAYSPFPTVTYCTRNAVFQGVVTVGVNPLNLYLYFDNRAGSHVVPSASYSIDGFPPDQNPLKIIGIRIA